MAWLTLVVAGLLEVIWASLLPATKGFSRLWPSVGFLTALTGSMILLSLAVRDLPVGTAYAVWVGIGAVGTSAVSVLVQQETMTLAQIAALAVLVVGIVAVKLTGSTD